MTLARRFCFPRCCGQLAVAALGLTTHWQAVRAAGIKPLLLAALLFAWLLGAGGLLTYWLG